jgi:signal transduction histidine kinase
MSTAKQAKDLDPTTLESIRDRLGTLSDPLTLLAGIFAFAPFGLQIYDSSGRSILTNQAFRDLFGSEPPPEYNVLRDEIAKAAGVLDLIQRAFRGETAHVPCVWYDPRQLTQVRVEEGHRVAIESTFLPLVDAAGNVAHVAIVFKDLTTETSLRAEAEKERDFLQRLIGVLGHDLQQPLTTVISGIDYARKNRDRASSTLERVKQTAARMSRMIANVVELTRIQARGEMPLTRREADLAEVTRSVVDELQLAYLDRRITVTTDGDAHGRWDVDRLFQVLANLIANALSYGDPATAVQVSVTGSPSDVTVRLHNNGRSIPEPELQHIFEPFQRGSAVNRRGGTPGLGLGLYIAREIVRAHGGDITASSGAATGTDFSVRLPRADEDRDDAV